MVMFLMSSKQTAAKA